MLNQKRLDRARRAFERACEGMTVEEVDEAIRAIVREVRAERAAMRKSIAVYYKADLTTFTELDVFYIDNGTGV